MTHTRRLIIVVTAAVAAQANTRAKELDTEGGERTWTVGLSPTGGEPPTHYWCDWQMVPQRDTALRTRLQALVDAVPPKAWVYNGNTRTPASILTELGLRRVGEAG